MSIYKTGKTGYGVGNRSAYVHPTDNRPRPAPKQQTGVIAPAPGAFTERAEALIGVDPMEELAKMRDAQEQLADYRERESILAAKTATYEARFGYPSHFEHERKNKLSTIVEQRRNEIFQRGETITEGALNSYSHSHADYKYILEAALRDRQEWERIKAELVTVRGNIEISKGLVTYFERKVRMAEAMLYAVGKEAGLQR